MSPEILQLEDYYLSRFHVDFHFPKEGKTQVDALSLSFDYDTLKHVENENSRMLTLRIAGCQLDSKEEKIGLDFEVEINGVFIVPESLESERQEALLRYNGVSILYSTLRGVIGNLSGSFPAGRLCLPTVLPNDVVQQIEAKKQAAKKVAKKATKKKVRKTTK